MMCDRCGNSIRGAVERVAIETGSGVAGEVLLCKGGCRPQARQRYPEEPLVLSAQIPRPRQRRSPRR